ncbi:electron transport complex subunit RsxC [Flavobacterium sp. Sd200]|uniref:electron transport complex subunit RsxC n=1 Tax=Flavobacterium sp. Sd200 TaxID=2692211 RepID=UPI00136F039A|nr:electron transport complex subunit RsxC [Flavobacterium sp. Sd200]MXN90476.1 electron transport complex subunit RsxC [Flavobacterium sp. Sd200]
MMHIISLKNKTKHIPITAFADPPELYVPLQGYKGIMQLLVQPGTTVKKHQKIAELTGTFACCIHAPVSGIVQGIEDINGQPHVKLLNDFKEDEYELPALKPERLSAADILLGLKEYGIEGSGGARFPTHLKYNIHDSPIDTFIINGAECEPYLSADYAILKNESMALVKAIGLLQKVINAKTVVIAIEKQHKELKKLLASNLSEQRIKIHLLPNEYPQGGELQLIKSVTGKELPKGCVPSQHGIVVSNVGTLWAVYNAFYSNKPYVERIITISGEKAKNLGNYIVKVGTPVSFIINKVGLEDKTSDQTVILGGPMMGKAIDDDRTPIHKGTGGLLILPEHKNNNYNCIQCGYCADVCPQKLMPMEFVRTEAQQDTEKLLQLHLNDCIECGACAYVCPSDIPLMKNIFAGKQALRAS